MWEASPTPILSWKPLCVVVRIALIAVSDRSHRIFGQSRIALPGKSYAPVLAQNETAMPGSMA
jgi:hypothetical protein